MNIHNLDTTKGSESLLWLWLFDEGTVKADHDYFSFLIINYPFSGSDIRAAPAYGVYTSQLVGYSIVCFQYRFSGQNSTADVNVTQTRLRCSFVKGIASNIIRLSSRTGFFLFPITIKIFWLPFWYIQIRPSQTSPTQCGFHIRNTNCLHFTIS